MKTFRPIDFKRWHLDSKSYELLGKIDFIATSSHDYIGGDGLMCESLPQDNGLNSSVVDIYSILEVKRKNVIL